MVPSNNIDVRYMRVRVPLPCILTWLATRRGVHARCDMCTCAYVRGHRASRRAPLVPGSCTWLRACGALMLRGTMTRINTRTLINTRVRPCVCVRRLLPTWPTCLTNGSLCARARAVCGLGRGPVQHGAHTQEARLGAKPRGDPAAQGQVTAKHRQSKGCTCGGAGVGVQVWCWCV